MMGRGSTRQTDGAAEAYGDYGAYGAEAPRRHRGASAAVTAALAWSFLGFVLGLGATGAAAQYTVLGGSAGPGAPEEETLRESVEEARWSVGPLRLQPWLGLRDVSYVRQQQSVSGEAAARDQLTVTVGAGLRAYAPVGSRVVWAAHALPEYVWWQDDESKDGLNGRYGMGFFGYANRLRFHLSHRLVEQQDFFSDEVQELTSTSAATSSVGAEVQVVRGIHVYGSWERQDIEGDAGDDVRFTLLDRVEDGWSAGVRLRSHRGWTLGVGVREAEGNFDDGARDLSFESEALTFDLAASVRRFQIDLRIEDAELRPQPGSDLPPLEETFGDARLGFEPPGRVGYELFAQRQRSFSIFASRALVVTQEQGLRLFLELGRSWNLRLLGGTGTLDAEGVAGAPSQSDEYDLWGATLAFTADRLGTLQLDFVQRSYDIGLLDGGREVSSLGLSLQLGALAERLSVGGSQSNW